MMIICVILTITLALKSVFATTSTINNLEIGYELARHGEFDKAAQYFEVALSSNNPSQYDIRLALGRIYSAQSREMEALTMFSQNIERTPNRPESYFRRGQLFASRNDHRSAITDFLQSIRRYDEEEDAVDVYLELASSTRTLCDQSVEFHHCIEKAVHFARHATELNPTRADAFHLLGYLESSSDPRLGLQHLQIAKSLSNTQTSMILLEDLARVSIRTGNMNQAVSYVMLKYAEEAFENGSRNAELKFALASGLANAGRVREASQYMKAALRENKVVLNAWSEMADSANLIGHNEQQCVVTSHEFSLHPDTKSCSKISKFKSTFFIENQIPFKMNLSSTLPSLSELLNKYGDVILPVSHIHSFGRSTLIHDDVVRKPATTYATFQDYYRVANKTNCGDSTFYVAQATLELYGRSELLEEFPNPTTKPVSQRNIWISRGGTMTPTHYDNYENLLSVVEGTKYVLLFNVTDRENMYFQTRTELEPRYDFRSQSLIYDNTEIKYTSNFAGVNVTHPNFNIHPRFAHVVPWFCRIDEGEALYIPKGWPHAVFSSVKKGGSGWNYGVNWWF